MRDPKKLSRRTFLSAIASTTATSCLPLTGAVILATESTETCAAQYTRVRASGEAAAPSPVAVINPGYRLLIDPEHGSIASFRATYGVDRGFADSRPCQLAPLQGRIDERSARVQNRDFLRGEAHNRASRGRRKGADNHY